MNTSARDILVVDDDEDLVRMVVRALEKAGFCGHGAGDARQAAEILQHVDPAGVILDMHLPGIHGVILCVHLRGHLGPQVPILFMSARDDVQSITAGLSAGGDDHLIKPVRVGELVARLNRLLAAAKATSLSMRRERILRQMAGSRSQAG